MKGRFLVQGNEGQEIPKKCYNGGIMLAAKKKDAICPTFPT